MNENNEKPEFRLRYMQVLEPAQPSILQLQSSLSRRAAIGRAISIPTALAALSASHPIRAALPVKAHRGAIHSLIVSPDGESLVSGASSDIRDAPLKIWKVHRGNSTPERDERLRTGVESLAISRDERLAVAPAVGPSEIRLPPWTGDGFAVSGPGATGCKAILYDPSGRFLLCAGTDGVLSIWRNGNQYPDRYYALGLGPLVAAQMSFSGNLLVVASEERVKLFRFSTGVLKAVAERDSSSLGGSIRCIVFAEEALVAVGLSSGTIAVLHAGGFVTAFMLRGHTAAVNCLAALRASLLASGGDDRVVRLWNLRTHRLMRTLTGHSAAVCSGAATPNSDKFFTGDRSGGLICWSTLEDRPSFHFADQRLAPPVVTHAPPRVRKPKPSHESYGYSSPGGVIYGPTIRKPCTAAPVPEGYICQCNCVPY